MAAAGRVVRVPVGLSASASQTFHWDFKNDIPVTVAAPQYLKLTQSRIWRTQESTPGSALADRHTRAAAAAAAPDPHSSSDLEPEVANPTQEAPQQADILVNIEPDQAATLFRSSDGLSDSSGSHRAVEGGVWSWSPESGTGYAAPSITAVLPPGMYTFKRSASQGALLIRAPPESGKTSMLQLLADHVGQGLSPDFDRVYYVSLGNVGKTVDGRRITFDEVWRAGNKEVDFGELWEAYNETEAVGRRTLLLVDDGEAAFDQPLPLFSYIKSAQSGKREMCTKVILVSSWGSNQVLIGGRSVETPGSWSDANTISLWPNPTSELPSLQYTTHEADELWDGWLRANSRQGYNTTNIQKWIMRTTERQPGTLSRVLERISLMGLWTGRKTEPEWRAAVTGFLLSPEFFNTLDSLGSLESMRKTLLQRNYSPNREAARSLARKLVEDINLQVSREQLTNDEEDAANELVRMGQLIGTTTSYSLPSKLHYQYLARTIYSGRLGAAGDVPD
ncbi:hypothetical protein KFL_008120020 [Klebsormidium nitens]|uniref:Uncharacterized protein n=1 Tax=Klebsormidium nitens TaxID=105231 RepID=A0A1Y1ILR7_KLENI|nr:hypothetical protein KFL_008120020 [Klebsormidium nitens]|eukprot:GAQ91583.1 hypothetical protein KFL_008120020 [Klebsormidium nitens]